MRNPVLGTRGRAQYDCWCCGLVLLAILAGLIPRVSQRRRATTDAKQLEVPNVSVVSASVGASRQTG